MSYVGKILVVVQVVLSLLFMSFAGAVFAIHQNWRTKHDNVQKQLTTADTNLRSVQEELTNARREFDAKLAQAQTEAQQAVARNATLTAQLAALQERTNNLEQQRQSQTGLAEAKASEARFRQEEAEKQRVENAKLQAKLDETAAENRELKDQMFTQEEAYRALNKRFETGLAQLAYLKRAGHQGTQEPGQPRAVRRAVDRQRRRPAEGERAGRGPHFRQRPLRLAGQGPRGGRGAGLGRG